MGPRHRDVHSLSRREQNYDQATIHTVCLKLSLLLVGGGGCQINLDYVISFSRKVIFKEEKEWMGAD